MTQARLALQLALLDDGDPNPGGWIALIGTIYAIAKSD